MSASSFVRVRSGIWSVKFGKGTTRYIIIIEWQNKATCILQRKKISTRAKKRKRFFFCNKARFTRFFCSRTVKTKIPFFSLFESCLRGENMCEHLTSPEGTVAKLNFEKFNKTTTHSLLIITHERQYTTASDFVSYCTYYVCRLSPEIFVSELLMFWFFSFYGFAETSRDSVTVRSLYHLRFSPFTYKYWKSYCKS